jgi:hypothetical protein
VAFGLFVILEKMKAFQQAKNVVETDLLWILQHQPNTLSAEQRAIREMVDVFVNH